MFLLAAFTLFVGWLMVYNGTKQIDYAERTLANAEPAVARVVSIEAAGVIALVIVVVGFRYRFVDGRAIAAGALGNS
jgi:uncharacterized membrane protein